MPHDPKLATRIREALSNDPGITEQQKMGGITFMRNGIVCVRAHSDGGMMMRCEPDMTEELLTKKGAKRFEVKNKPMMNGWLVISPEGLATKKDFDFWIRTALDYNTKVQANPKKKK